MRWLLGITMILGGIAGTLFAVGWFLLPAQLDVSRSIDIDRPRASVYALVSNLRTFNEFSPWVEIDPAATYTFSGPTAAVGQQSNWSSTSPVLGSGSIRIKALKPYSQVDLSLAFGESRARSAFQIAGSGLKTRVTWSFAAACHPGPEAVPCRYINQLARGQIERNYDLGLAKLKALAEELPNADFEGLAITQTKVEPVDFAFHDSEVALEPAQMLAAERAAFAFVRDFLQRNAMTAAGPPIAETLAWDEAQRRYGFRAGYAYTGVAPAVAVGVRLGKSPSGVVVKAVHTGSYESLPETYLKLEAYVRAHRLRIAGPPWQVYVGAAGGQEPAATRTEIYFPIAGS